MGEAKRREQFLEAGGQAQAGANVWERAKAAKLQAEGEAKRREQFLEAGGKLPVPDKKARLDGKLIEPERTKAKTLNMVLSDKSHVPSRAAELMAERPDKAGAIAVIAALGAFLSNYNRRKADFGVKAPDNDTNVKQSEE